MFPYSLASIFTFACLSSVSFADLAPHNQSTLYDYGLFGAYPHQNFVTVDYEAPRVNIKQWSDQCDDGKYVLLTPRGRSVPNPGPMLLDSKGSMVWSGKDFGMASDLKVQQYRGQDYLTFWTGRDDGTHGYGFYHMLNSSYDVVRTIRPVGKLLGDLHEFAITDSGTALLTIYGEPEHADLSAFGRRQPGWIKDSFFQEIDLETGDLIFEWRASDHYNIHDTMAPIGKHAHTKDDAFDYFHINSIDKDDVGNYYISSRYMQTITCISPYGVILWKLGGRHNDFTDLSGGAATNFSWQHHMRWHPGNRITLFDNGAFNWLPTAKHSRGLYIQLDVQNMTAELIQDFVKPGVLAHSQGSVQLIPETGNVFIGWGHSSAYTEFVDNGDILCDVHYGPSAFFGLGSAKSYRAFKAHWVGQPRTVPEIVLKDGAVYVSWNGATEVARWRLETSSIWNGTFIELQQTTKDGFETKIPLTSDVTRHSRDRSIPQQRYYRISALDKYDQELTTSKTVDSATGHVVDEMKSEPAMFDNISVLTLSIVVFCLLCAFFVAGRRLGLISWNSGNQSADQTQALLDKDSEKEM